MKNKKIFAIIALTAACLIAFPACGGGSSTSSSSQKPADSSSSGSSSSSSTEPVVVYGLPLADVGHYIKDADVFDDGETRYAVYTTNSASGEEDNVIGVRKATYDLTKQNWAYGTERIILTGVENKWDAYLGSASVVKGVYKFGNENYQWLMAYCATDKTNDTQYEIGLAVSKEMDGTWIKVSETPLIAFDSAVYGSSAVGCYAPSLVNLDKESKVRIFYSYADAYGHFAQFIDVDAADLDAVYSEDAKTDVNIISGMVQVPTNGNLSGGDAAMMFPNSDFAYDETNHKFYMVKDYSPSAALTPAYAQKIEVASLSEAELYTAEILEGWRSYKVWTMLDTEEDEQFERIYSGCIVSDAYGHLDGAEKAEIIYNHCELEADNEDWMFTQNLSVFDLSFGD